MAGWGAKKCRKEWEKKMHRIEKKNENRNPWEVE